jgi:hypothetical protein
MVDRLVIVIGVLAIVAALAGLFWPGGDGPYITNTWRGQEVEIFGRGIYRDSSTFTGAGARGTDAVSLMIGVPLLAISLSLHRRGSIRGMLLLAGALTWMLYAFGSMALGAVAYHDFFLLHVAIFGASLWALILLFTTVDTRSFGTCLEAGIPRRGLAIFLIVSGAVTAGIWLIEPLSSLVTGQLPDSLGVSTTLFTTALDIAVIVPATWITAGLVLQGRPAGYLLAMPILILEALLAPMITVQTLFQLDARIAFSTVQMIVMIGGFLVLALIAIWMVVRVLRHVEEHATSLRLGAKPAM